MIEISATAIYWFITLGLVIGLTVGVIMGKEGTGVPVNIIWGVAAAILTGVIGIKLNFGDGLLFSMAGTLAVLFLVNAFHQHHAEDIYGHTDRDILIKNRE
ncbi:hypothetical protein G3570_07905 [Balneolaceae bacterium YR4-1]|uniref:Transglycosylase associated protein n=1 Tax=Halalkalibaculum roseum TaxID=2709311 RepID=A0A6M1SUS5_9BACT|nr:hypothetical protein [Halalkalibaculum roseum]NGP76552.1 hypothetical protein [Halalkalibaculum roseum]